jgi:sulfoxide reductase heme-binding subunit YedZ
MLRPAATGLLIGLVLLALFAAVAARLGLAVAVTPTIAGAAPWTTARAFGLTALLAVTADVVFGLLVSTGVADRLIPRARAVDVHLWLSSIALTLIAGHVLALMTDRFVRFDALDVVVPFLSSYRPVAVGVGILAAYGAVVVHVSFALRRRIGTRAWRRLHFVSFAVFVTAIAHGLAAGTDSDLRGLQVFYAWSAIIVGVLALYRVLGARRARQRSSDMPPLGG